MGNDNLGNEAEISRCGQRPRRPPIRDDITEVVVQDVNDLVVDNICPPCAVRDLVAESSAMVALIGLSPWALQEIYDCLAWTCK
jgi:hypothetical protein